MNKIFRQAKICTGERQLLPAFPCHDAPDGGLYSLYFHSAVSWFRPAADTIDTSKI